MERLLLPNNCIGDNGLGFIAKVPVLSETRNETEAIYLSTRLYSPSFRALSAAITLQLGCWQALVPNRAILSRGLRIPLCEINLSYNGLNQEAGLVRPLLAMRWLQEAEGGPGQAVGQMLRHVEALRILDLSLNTLNDRGTVAMCQGPALGDVGAASVLRWVLIS